ncbi:MAG: RagB/SusD family nutrient uptake outer membrane protein, partial [Prevotellaceae bacterium]|nr:RagB/SusD family nutrient uptake outer membrane protein [Prevotellaceae bacterium]
MKNINKVLTIAVAVLMLASCGDDFLTVYPRNSLVSGGDATEEIVKQNIDGAYQILLFESYANGNNNGIPYFSDFRSDDLYKGGGNKDDQVAFNYMAQFECTSVNVSAGWWTIYYAGLKRCNGALDAIDHAVNIDAATLARYRAETLTLRAYFVHWLWKTWGNIPYFDKVWTEPPYVAPQLSFDELYPKMIADLDAAIATPELPLAVSGAETGRIGKAMAMMTKARVVMYKNDQSKYAEVLADMNTIIGSGSFELIMNSPDATVAANPIDWMFMREGENCRESIFETQNISEGKSWGSSWHGFGNYTPCVISPRD